jgi:hypothetical protein
MEQRRTRRFQLQLPLSVTRSGAERVALAGYTKNISSNGVLFTTTSEPDLGGPIEYVIMLNREGPLAVSLRCMGKILRADRIENGNGSDVAAHGYQIAVTLERYEFVREQAATRRPS